MKILNFKIQNYRRFDEFTLNLTPGLNVILGKNESGKSTIAKAFLDALYTDPTTNSRVILENITSWKGRPPILELNFIDEKNEFKIKKDFEKKELVFENLDSGKQITDYKESLEVIGRLTGITNQEVYQSTAYIDQGDVARVAGNQGLLHELTSLGNVDESSIATRNVVKQLKSEQATLKRGLERPANNPGPIKQLQDSITNLEKNLSEKKTFWEKRQSASEIKDKSDLKLKEVDENIQLIEALLKNNQKREVSTKELENLNQEIQKLETKLQELEKIQKQEVDINSKLKEYAKFENSELEQDNNLLNENEGVLKVMRKQLKEVMKETDVVEKVEKPKTNKTKKYIVLSGLIFLITVILGALIYYFQGDLLIPGIVVLIGLLSSIAILIWSRISRQLDEKKETKQELRESGRVVGEELRSKISVAEKNVAKILNKYGVKSTEEFFAIKAEKSALKENLTDLISRKNSLVGEGTSADLEKRQTELLLRKKEIENVELTEDVKTAQLTPEDIYKKKKDLDKLKLEKRKLETDLIASNTRIGDTEVEYKDLVEIEEEIELSKEKLNELLRKDKVLELAVVTMDLAIKEVSRSANQVLTDFVENKLPGLTGNRYSKIRVNTDLSVEVFSTEKNNWVDPIKNLSRGTVDQIYFLTRLGFVNLLTQGKTIPLILDDPFVTSDEYRLLEIRSILEQASSEYQILLFTNEKNYLDWGNAITI